MSFTCINCRVAFSDSDIQRAHYKTDWHRYNLKRKVAELPPVTAEEFQRRVLLQREKNEAGLQPDGTYCLACRKSFSSSNAFNNHLSSKKHKQLMTAHELDEGSCADVIRKPIPKTPEASDGMEDEDDSDFDDVDSDDWDEYDQQISEDNPILKNNCLFCSHHSASLYRNINHMTSEHCFFIPDIEYVTDVRSLLLYLGEKVCRFYMCLWCNFSGREFHSMEAAQTHMRDKGHCKMLHEGATLLEYENYYNYSKSYPDHDDGIDVNEEVVIPELDGSDFQLKLPSGATIGHRLLFSFYKQRFNPNSVVAIKRPKLNHVLSTYRALGWTETDKKQAALKARDLRFMKKVQSKNWQQVGVKANKLQKHFRPQVNF